MRDVFNRLREYSLYVKLLKCYFKVDTINFLGFFISLRGIEMEPNKVSSILDWPRPRSVKEIMSFLGFANFYRRFIVNFLKVVRLLTDLTKKGTGQF